MFGDEIGQDEKIYLKILGAIMILFGGAYLEKKTGLVNSLIIGIALVMGTTLFNSNYLW